ncbi:MAG: metal ABC transporter permease [Phycisphaeraceae bacterium]|nr:metal ABC transporter permease [Phycisphaerales bacterium]MCB9860569.1 metal ABC transporter permease [Phycisphaeraceae bacterium]
MMPDLIHRFVVTDLVPMLTALFVAITCALLGSFLVLRRQSMMGDAISHSVLPGLAASFLLLGTRSSTAMLVGAAIAGVGTVLLIEIVKRFGKVEPGAAMGVVFSVLFALGVVLIEVGARDVDLDPDCVLHGVLEGLAWWGAPKEWSGYFSITTYTSATTGIPRQLPTALVVMVLISGVIVLAFKELRIASFDPGLASSLEFRAGAINAVLMILVAIATVASFEAVGSILVIALLICPAASARILTDRLHVHVILSVLIAAITSVAGYAFASWIAPHIGFPNGISTAGTIAVTSGVALGLAVVFSPTHGLVGQMRAQRAVQERVLVENLIGTLYRIAESSAATSEVPRTSSELQSFSDRVYKHASAQHLVTLTQATVSLTDAGRKQAAELVRRHRLWETYLVEEAGLRPDHVHETAEQLEHARRRRGTTIEPEIKRETDPHGKPIPSADR